MKQALDGQSSNVISRYLPFVLKAKKICERHMGATRDGEMANLSAMVVARGLDAVLWATVVGQCVGVATIIVTAPNGGESLNAGVPTNITWLSFGGVGNVRIELSRDNGGTWGDIAASVPNTGTYAWTPSAPASALCLVRVSSVAGPGITDRSDAVFSIVAAAPVAPIFMFLE